MLHIQYTIALNLQQPFGSPLRPLYYSSLCQNMFHLIRSIDNNNLNIIKEFPDILSHFQGLISIKFTNVMKYIIDTLSFTFYSSPCSTGCSWLGCFSRDKNTHLPIFLPFTASICTIRGTGTFRWAFCNDVGRNPNSICFRSTIVVFD